MPIVFYFARFGKCASAAQRVSLRIPEMLNLSFIFFNPLDTAAQNGKIQLFPALRRNRKGDFPMKKRFFALMLCLLCAVCAAASAEIVTALESGYRNISFSNGYNGFCIDHHLQSPPMGEKFTVAGTDEIMSNKFGTPVGNYLKIMFTQFADEIFNPSTDVSQLVWPFSNYDYPNYNAPLIRDTLALAEGGLVIPDHGMKPVRFGDDMVVFDFCMLKAENPKYNDFFAYKITVVGDAESGDTNPGEGVPPAEGNGETEKPALPATGDRENILLWLAVLAASSVCLAALIRRAKEA